MRIQLKLLVTIAILNNHDSLGQGSRANATCIYIESNSVVVNGRTLEKKGGVRKRIEDGNTYFHTDYINGYLTIVADSNNNYGIINSEEKIVLPLKYNSVDGCFGNNRLMVKKGRGYGFVNPFLKIVIPCHYKRAQGFYYNLSCVKRKKLYGFIDTNGRCKIPFKFDACWPFNPYGTSVVHLKGKYGLINRKGKIVLPIEFDRFDFGYENQRYIFYKGEKQYSIDQQNGEIVDEKMFLRRS